MATDLLSRRTVRGWELRHGIEAYAHQMAAALKLRPINVVWRNIGTAAISANGTMILAAVRDDAVIDRRLLVRYVGFVLHELLHRKHTSFDVNASDSYLARLHNAVEDVWIERLAIKAALTGNIKGVLADLTGQIVDESRAAVQDWADPAQYPFALAITARGYGPTVPLAAGLAPIFAEASARIDLCKSTSDTLQVAVWVHDQIKQAAKQSKQKDEQQGEQQGQQQSGQQDGQQGEQQGEQQSGQQGEQQGQQQSEQQGGGQGKGEQEAGAVRAPGQTAAPVEPTLDTGSAAGGQDWNADNAIVPAGEHLSHVRRTITPIASSARLRAEVRRLFDNSGHEQTHRNLKAGSINVYALPLHGATDRIFQRRIDAEGIDSAVVLCLDISGSMYRDINEVADIACLFDQTLRSAGVSTAIVTFNSRASISMPFGSTPAKAREVCEKIAGHGGTHDFAAVRLACDMLLPRPEERKAIIVVTDGDGYVSDCRAQVAAAEALGITVIGIGLDHSVGHVYRQSVRVNSAKELGSTLFNKIRMAA